MNNRSWRILQIAKTIIYRYFGDVSIELTDESFGYDLIVRCREESSLKFGVVVKSSYFKQSVEYRELITAMRTYSSNLEKGKMPIILISVNETQESASVGFLMGWRFGQPYLYQDFEMRQLTQKNADVCLDIIKSMDQTIRVLSMDNVYIAKQILIKQAVETGYSNAELLYLRKISPEYTLKPKKIVSEKEKFERLKKGIPQEDYPSDELDDCILSAVRERYDNCTMINRMIVTSTELQDLIFYYNKQKQDFHTTSLSISMDCASMTIPLEMVIYKAMSESSIFDGVVFSRVLKSDEIDKYYKIKNVCDSLLIVSQLVNK